MLDSRLIEVSKGDFLRLFAEARELRSNNGRLVDVLYAECIKGSKLPPEINHKLYYFDIKHTIASG
ncbi:hypothetical protein SCALIN_C01_0056 [Candidatus Scalindua japonica]|uniref:Uncharacterized protein n=1 Tax=Candidatus Scalindua japonica TaxID=1284222 RepID=A0A286TTE5_9BACT|nr:hypothetical protein [Candidatus Scalindua japonica]GAX59125.1 hypothetical protein SCALIN_C01_0056 [Candidatus Scalindua japonica]